MGGVTIEAIYVIEIPTRLSLDGPLPPIQLESARAALKHAKELGETYKEVEVATAVVRARRVGSGIVQEARRRGVEAIVLAAERTDGGGAGQGSAKAVGEVASYVLEKAPCPVIVTAPSRETDRRADG